MAYRLLLPANCKFHDVLHVSLLQRYRQTGDHQSPPATTFFSGEEEWEIATILMHRNVKIHPNSEKTRLEFLISWLNSKYDTWKPEQSCVNYSEKVREYLEKISGGEICDPANESPSAKARDSAAELKQRQKRSRFSADRGLSTHYRQPQRRHKRAPHKE